jgi:hypothetical protein
MNERTSILRYRNNSASTTIALPKTGGVIFNFFTTTLDAISDFLHKWAKP